MPQFDLSPRWPRFLIPLVLLVAVGVLFAGFELTRRAAGARLAEQAAITAQIRAQALEGVMMTQRAVAATLAEDGLVRAVLRQPEKGGAIMLSRKLERLQGQTGSSVIYLLDRSGQTLSASNWNQPISFVGGDYSMRDYFKEALRDGTALEFAMGRDSLRPGLYISHDVREGGDVLGVLVVKVELGTLEATWGRSADRTWVVDDHGQVVLSSEAGAQFQPLPSARTGIEARVEVPGARGWDLVLTTSRTPATVTGLVTVGALLMAELVVAWYAWRAARIRRRVHARVDADRRRREELEAAVADRTRSLTAEIGERMAAEASLARMQADLVQANKLATLGQVTAGVAHEINQPLATIRLLADNGLALLDDHPDEARDNLRRIVGMTDRIAQITAHLRGFARKATGRVGPVALKDVLEASVLLTASRRRAEGARLIVTGIPNDLRVMAEAVPLEQVLVNLIQNAQEAVTGQPDGVVRVSVRFDQHHVTLTVSDNGPGLAPEVAAQLFTPFVTSKDKGLGLGLVIAKGIARDLGGELTARPPAPGEGAAFILKLVRA